MKRIGNSKIPTPAQMQAMTDNLQEQFGESAKVEAYAWTFKSDNRQIRFRIYVESFIYGGKLFKTWPEALAFYRELMKGKVPSNA